MLLALLLLLLYALSSDLSWAPRCLILGLTGWQCPACGTQRALQALLHGAPLAALRYNYYLLVLLPVAVLYLVDALGSKRLLRLHGLLYHRWTILSLGASALLWVLLRNLWLKA